MVLWLWLNVVRKKDNMTEEELNWDPYEDKQQEAERQRAIREEEERQRQQREWEQSPEGKATIAEWNAEWKRRDERENRISCLIGFIIFLLLSPVVIGILRVLGVF